MSRTDIDPSTIAKALRRMAGDGSMEWCYEPMQASVLLDVADMLDENAELRALCTRAYRLLAELFPYVDYSRCTALEAVASWMVRACELGIEVEK